MIKLAAILGVIGLALLLVSLAPVPAGVGLEAEATGLPPAEMVAGAVVEDAVVQGQALFLAKGCATCHQHDAVGDLAEISSVGPNLTHYQPDPGFVRRWLRDPAAVRPDTNMPDLNLSDDEITTLIAFLGAGKEKKGSLAASLDAAAASCPVTQPADPPFTPPVTGSPNKLHESLFWHGSNVLWTQLPRDGVWRDLPLNERGYTQKIFFSREGYSWIDEQLPALTISGRRLDVAGPAFEELEATNGFHPDIGSFMLIGVDIPTEGCWEFTGHYHGHDLSFVAWVEPE